MTHSVVLATSFILRKGLSTAGERRTQGANTIAREFGVILLCSSSFATLKTTNRSRSQFSCTWLKQPSQNFHEECLCHLHFNLGTVWHISHETYRIGGRERGRNNTDLPTWQGERWAALTCCSLLEEVHQPFDIQLLFSQLFQVALGRSNMSIKLVMVNCNYYMSII